MSPKILYLDIETSYHVTGTFGLYNQNIGITQIIEPTSVIAVSAKFTGRKTKFWSLYHHSRDEMLEGIWQMMNESDIQIHYNGNDFDIKHLNTEFWVGGFPPYAPSRQIDLLRVMRQNFKFASNKLAYVTQAVGLPTKLENAGFGLWRRCMEGDKQAWKDMKSYSIQDTEILEPLYESVKPWIWNSPNAQLYGATGDACPECGGYDLRRDGFAYLSAGKYQRFQCRGCGKYSQSTRRDSGVTLKGINPR